MEKERVIWSSREMMIYTAETIAKQILTEAGKDTAQLVSTVNAVEYAGGRGVVKIIFTEAAQPADELRYRELLTSIENTLSIYQ